MNEPKAIGNLFHNIPNFQLKRAFRDPVSCINPLPVTIVVFFQIKIAQIHVDEGICIVWKVTEREDMYYVFVAPIAAKFCDSPQLVFYYWTSVEPNEV